MSKAEILAELPRLSAGERDEVRRRLAELDDENADAVALARAEELGRGSVATKTQAEIFRNARAALS
jgi:acyl-CoA reductase-like NAD-dependent aldehyde dehydrogenase